MTVFFFVILAFTGYQKHTAMLPGYPVCTVYPKFHPPLPLHLLNIDFLCIEKGMKNLRKKIKILKNGGGEEHQAVWNLIHPCIPGYVPGNDRASGLVAGKFILEVG